MKMVPSKLSSSRGSLQYHLSGSGSPPIVLINGGSGPIEGWMRILPEIATVSTVFAYNRFGVAGSDKPSEAQDGLTIVETLREALSIVGLQPPYLLVGHSLGGLYANLYARSYPDEVAGVIFLESSHPKDLSLEQYQGKFVKKINKLLSIFDSWSPHKAFSEVHFVDKTVEQISERNLFPQIPIYVITGMKENRIVPEIVQKKRLEHQLELLSLSTNHKHIPAQQSGHFPQLTEPSVVIDAIKACMNEINH
ncbi:alpha/beta fold hydrolase [Paenibacillus sp. YYML68]|uniref:alpha/beta fold hydrolase n=1 Tax=Paenibacillus sp. YYML68 TaxID=2909250 RepID=UPI002493CDF2|nr:alpha/beta hydrolase [Paenibacillus sp. YYML68]